MIKIRFNDLRLTERWKNQVPELYVDGVKMIVTDAREMVEHKDGDWYFYTTTIDAFAWHESDNPKITGVNMFGREHQISASEYQIIPANG